MIGLASILKGATVYGSESWVMTKPGLFQKKVAVAGYAALKLFRDIVYRPAWESVGIWNTYSAITKIFKKNPPITMDQYRNIIVRSQNYASKRNVRKRIAKNLKKLQPGLLKS